MMDSQALLMRQARDGSMSRMAPPLRVLLVDDHEVVRSGLAALLKATGDIVVAGEAGTVKDAIEQLINNEDRQAMERDNALALFPRLQPHTA